MKKLVVALLCLLPFVCSAQTGFYVTWPQLRVFAATNANSGGTNIISGLGVGIPTNSPNIFWTNNVYKSFWTTNANFTIGQVGLASSNFFTSSILISNAGPGVITATLPYPAYSISMASTVGSAVIASGNALDLSFSFNGGITYIADKGANSLQLQSIAASVLASNGVLTAQSGLVNVTTNVTLWNLSVLNQTLGNYFATVNGTSAGMQFFANDTLGTVNVNLYNRTGVNGLSIVNNSLDLSDMVETTSSGAQGNERFEHRFGQLVNAGNTTGERQFLIGTGPSPVTTGAFGTNAAVITTSLYTQSEITSNLTTSAGFITNKNLIFCTTTNLPINTNYVYFTILYPGGWMYVSSNNGTGGVWVKR